MRRLSGGPQAQAPLHELAAGTKQPGGKPPHLRERWTAFPSDGLPGGRRVQEPKLGKSCAQPGQRSLWSLQALRPDGSAQAEPRPEEQPGGVGRLKLPMLPVKVAVEGAPSRQRMPETIRLLPPVRSSVYAGQPSPRHQLWRAPAGAALTHPKAPCVRQPATAGNV